MHDTDHLNIICIWAIRICWKSKTCKYYIRFSDHAINRIFKSTYATSLKLPTNSADSDHVLICKCEAYK